MRLIQQVGNLHVNDLGPCIYLIYVTTVKPGLLVVLLTVGAGDIFDSVAFGTHPLYRIATSKEGVAWSHCSLIYYG